MRRIVVPLAAGLLLITACARPQPVPPAPAPVSTPALGSTAPAPATLASVPVAPAAETWLTGLRFTDARTGWVTGALRGCEGQQLRCQGAVWATADAGATWVQRYRGDVIPLSVDFVSPDTGWVAGGTVDPGVWLPPVSGTPGVLMHTSNGGQSWDVAFRDDGEAFRYVHFTSDQVGWVGSSAHLWRTTDGGRNWTSVTPPRCSTAPPGQGCVFSFWADDAGAAVGFGGSGMGRQAKAHWVTRDVGQHWDLVESVSTEPSKQQGTLPVMGYVKSIYFADAQRGWLSLSPGGLWATTDGGVTWRDPVQVQAPPNQPRIVDGVDYINATALQMLDKHMGYALLGGAVVMTDTGGATWRSLSCHWETHTPSLPDGGRVTPCAPRNTAR